MGSQKSDYRLLDHTADLGIIVYGTGLGDLFESAAIALTRIMFGEISIPGTGSTRLSVDGTDLEDLMVRWTGEVLYLFQEEMKCLTRVDVTAVSPSRLEASIRTARRDPAAGDILCDIKGVTYHQIQVQKQGRRWEARVIFDV